MTARRKDCGLNKPLNHTYFGRPNSALQSANYLARYSKSFSQGANVFREGYATLVQDAGTISKRTASITRSIYSEIVNSPFKPSLTSVSVYFITVVKLFIRSHSYMQTQLYGWASGFRSIKSATLKLSGII